MHGPRHHLQAYPVLRLHGRGADALARRRAARHACAGRCAGPLHPDPHARAVGQRRRRGAASLRQRHGVEGAPARARRGRYGRTGRAQRPDRFTARRRRWRARSLRAVAVPGGDAGVPVHRGLPDAVAHPQLRRRLPHGAVAGPAVPLHRPSRAGAAHRALYRQAALDRGGAGHRPGDAAGAAGRRRGEERAVAGRPAVRGRRLRAA